VEFGGGASFDAGHDHDCSDCAPEVFERADFIMFVDVRDPRFRRDQPIGLDVTTVSIGVLPAAGWMKVTSMSATQCDVVADPTLALEALVDSIADNGHRPLAHAFREFAGLLALPEDASAAAPFHPGVLGSAMASAVGDGPYVVANGWLSGWARRTMRYRAGQFLGRSGGEGLGFGLGASIGAALAHRDDDTLVIDFQGDGDLLFTPQALWTAAHHDIPLLVVVEKNGTYFRDVFHQEAVARQRRRGDAIVGPGLNFERPSIDISAIARAQGIATWEIPTDMASLDATLAEAVSTVRRGAPALVEVPLVGMK
jgi:thiamine pyrophosphate-dependent acetolactate synthase large subunit-like protein